MLTTMRNFSLFGAVKIRGRVGEMSIPIVEALPTTEPLEYICWPSSAWLLSAVYL